VEKIVGIVDVNALGQSQRTMYEHNGEIYRARFEAFGWQAVVIDGHDIRQIVAALDQTTEIKDKPSVIVALTKKGKGVSFVEDKNGWHGKAFKKGEEMERALAELEPKIDGRRMTMKAPDGRTVVNPPGAVQAPHQPSYNLGDQIATREAYGEGLARIGNTNPLVVALDGDTKNSTFSEKFLKAHPTRFFESFIAEQNMIGAAVGLSASGKIPFASTFACFLTRAYDQIRMAAISQANLKLCGSHAGVSIGEDGPSQMALEDLAMMRAIEGSTVLYPSDAVAAEAAVRLAAENHGIVYIRTSRPKTPVLYASDEKFQLGRAKVVRRSDQDRVTIVAGGVTLF